MSTDDNSRQRHVRSRIASFMVRDAQVRGKEVTQEETQTLRAASDRLDQLLKEFADAEEARCKEVRETEVQALRTAACRLDRLLAGVTWKEAMPELKLRRPKKDTTE